MLETSQQIASRLTLSASDGAMSRFSTSALT